MDAIKVPDSTFPVQSYRVIALYWTPEPRTLEPFSQTKLEKNNNYLIYRFKMGNVSSKGLCRLQVPQNRLWKAAGYTQSRRLWAVLRDWLGVLIRRYSILSGLAMGLYVRIIFKFTNSKIPILLKKGLSRIKIIKLFKNVPIIRLYLFAVHISYELA